MLYISRHGHAGQVLLYDTAHTPYRNVFLSVSYTLSVSAKRFMSVLVHDPYTCASVMSSAPFSRSTRRIRNAYYGGF